MCKFCLFMLEDGHYIRLKGEYATEEEAFDAAIRSVDDALPNNTVRVIKEVGYAFLAGDGSSESRKYDS